jgi:predicted permease
MQTLWQDLRYGWRMMRKAPGFTAIAVLSLALGIGANTALFSLMDAVLLKTLPVKSPGQLVVFNWQAGRPFRTPGMRGTFVGGYPPGMRGGGAFHYRSFEKMRDESMREPNSPLSEVFAFAWVGDLNALVDGQAEMAKAQVVSGGYYAGLGVPPLLGRLIADDDDNAGATPVAVISHQYWRERFGANRDVVGKQINLNQTTFTIIGVTPPAFTGTLQVGERPAVTVPIAFAQALDPESRLMDKPGKTAIWWINLMGRLKPNATTEQAQESLDNAFQSLAMEMMPPPRNEKEPAQIEAKDYPHLLALSGSKGMWEMRSIYSSTIYLLFGVVGLVLLIACANVANLLLARAALRASEITIRLAVGAGRFRLVRQLLTESLLLAALGGALGVLFALWGKDALAAMGGGGGFLPADMEYSLSWRVLGFTLGISLLTGVLFGLAPAWRATSFDLTTALKESHRTTSSVSRSRLSKVLVIAQVAMSLILLIGAGLFVRTLRNLQQVEVGFNQENLLRFSLQPRTSGYKDERLVQLYQQLFARFDGIPGARSVTFERIPVLNHWASNLSLILPGETAQTGAEHMANTQIVRENYFTTMEIPLLAGRGFTERDDQHSTKVAIINETLARQYFPDEDPLGKRVGVDDETVGKIEIIGVVRDSKYNSQREEMEPLIYTPWLQESKSIGEMFFAMRAAGDPTALVAAVRQSVSEIDNNLPVTNVKTQVAQSRDALTEERLFANLLTFFGSLALLLAAIGLYGVMAYSVAQRTNEIGIRMALGAQTSNVMRMVIWQGMRLVLVGIIVGAIGAYALKQVIASQLYGVGPTDPLTFAIVGGVLLEISLLACYVPARRATKVDPMVALRYE